jgi:hypothetical protein
MSSVSSLTDFQHECFLIAPIGEEGSDVRRRSDRVLRYIIEPAASELGLSAVRADEIAAPGQITLRVIEHILHARAAVADLTGRNPNVFYELAVRHTARLPVALIVAHDERALPFDIQQMSTIRFDHTDLESADLCRRNIVAHLSAAMRGAVDSPVTTSVDLTLLAADSSIDEKLARFFEDMRTTLQTYAASNHTIVEVLRSVDLPRSSEAERKVEAALGEAVERVVAETRESLFVQLDPSPLFEERSQPWLLRYDREQTVSEFLNNIWFKLSRRARLPPHRYASAWVLRDMVTGEELPAMGRIWAERFGQQKDLRAIAEAGILPGMQLQAVRPRRPGGGDGT